jgi:hypothetical protein
MEDYTTYHVKYYKQVIGCSNITLNEKIRMAAMASVCYGKQSILIPHELKPEVQDDHFIVPPVNESDNLSLMTKYSSFIVRYKSRNDCCLLTML